MRGKGKNGKLGERKRKKTRKENGNWVNIGKG